MTPITYDFIAIGLGPFNLSLAALTSNISTLNGLFLEQKDSFNWHPGLMLESAHLQTPFLSDLVTLADPTHPLSFLNYCKQQGRLYAFYIREDFFLMRKEYNLYCRWAIEQLSNIRFSTCVTAITYNEHDEVYELMCAPQQYVFRCRKLVLGTGPAPHLPTTALPVDADRVIHASDYLANKANLQDCASISIVGGGQSAAEIYFDLLQDIDQANYQLNWISRSPRFFPLEYSKLTLEMTSPDYIDYFHQLPSHTRDALNRSQQTLYKGINSDLINQIYDCLYVKSLDGPVSTDLYTLSEVVNVVAENSQSYQLQCLQHEQESPFTLSTAAIIFATGFSYKPPACIRGITEHIQWDSQHRFAVNRNYSIDNNNRIFVQNAELHTHGFTAPDLGMACYRNSVIIRALTGIEVYPIEERIAFQTFGIQG